MELLVKFIATDNVEEIDNYIKYIEEIFEKLFEHRLVKGILIPPDKIKQVTNLVKELDNQENVFLIEFNSKEMEKFDNWNIVFKYGTYNNLKQLEVAISSDTYIVDKDNNYLEKLKILIKKIILKKWKKIIWLVDKDSECLSIELYSKIYKVENLMRQLINEVMIKQYGISWWDLFIPYKIKQKHRNRQNEYKSKVPAFNNVDERLMSIDMDDLGELITLERYKWNPEYDEKINCMLNDVQNYNDDKVRELLFKQKVIDIDLWKEQFSKYLPEDFYSRYKCFSKDRNHIMHNKLIDRSAYKLIKDLAEEIENNLIQAIMKLKEMILSDEDKEKIEVQKQIELEMIEILEHECRENDANVSIKSHNEIKELFENTIFEFLDTIEENLRFRSDIEVIRMYDRSCDESGDLLSVNSKIDGTELLFTYDMVIVDEEGVNSKLAIYHNNRNREFITAVVYTNGAVEFDYDSGLYMPIIQDKIRNIETAVEKIEEFINGEIVNYRESIEESDIVEFILCSECGEEAICINEDVLEIGICLSCGYINDIYQCERCGEWFNNEEDGMYNDGIAICQNCLDKLDEE